MFSAASVEPFFLLLLLMLPHRWLHGIRAHRWTTRWKEQHEHTHTKRHGKYNAANARNNEMWIFFSSSTTLFMSWRCAARACAELTSNFRCCCSRSRISSLAFYFFFRVWCYFVLVFSFDISCWFRANDSFSLSLFLSLSPWRKNACKYNERIYVIRLHKRCWWQRRRRRWLESLKRYCRCTMHYTKAMKWHEKLQREKKNWK